ncbi:MAG: efflux RND transporter periplasmic adaptor subunit [Candidatus Sulfotelmatobacter sp.]|jgi:membrane fusion protein, copper/silver efflux system
MSKTATAGVLVVTVVAFAAGYLIHGSKPAEAKHVLYYVDPMHPSYRSDKPGIAPDCGMVLVPVYEGERLGDQLQLAPNTFFVDGGAQKLTDVRVEEVSKTSRAQMIRTTGRVEPDQNRLYRVTAATEGWVRSLGNNAAGTMVKKGEVLGTYFSFELRGVEAGYIGALQVGQQDRVKQTNLRISEDQLRSLGMSDEQIHEIEKTHEYVSDIKIVSPVDGIVISRSITLQQRFQAPAEFYSIADLSKIWITADVYSDQAASLPPGTRASVTVPGLSNTLPAVVSNSLPLFDPISRTLKVRLEADNPGLVLRPDMFVDVEFKAMPRGNVSVPAEAVIDNGQHRVVYVETGTDLFEPRPVEVGEAYDGRVVILQGLQAGDRVVTSGTFLIDSESRMRPTTSPSVGQNASPNAKPE